MEKFSSKMDAHVLAELRAYAENSGRTVASVVNEAVAEYLQRQQSRPAVRASFERVLTRHEDALRRLAK